MAVVGQDQTADDRLALVRRVAEDLLAADGELPPDLRAAAFAHASEAAGRAVPGGAMLPEPLAGFVMKVTAEAYRVVDADVDALRQAGYSEDAIFEAVLSTAVGAGLARYEIGLAGLAGRA